MKKHQFEEIIFSLSVIIALSVTIALMCYNAGLTWSFYLFTFKAVLDFKFAVFYCYKTYLKDKQKRMEMYDIKQKSKDLLKN